MVTETANLLDLAPKEAARILVQSADEAWIFELQRSLDRHRTRTDLDRILAAWNLRQSDAAELFHVSRQAIGKWRTQGVPKNQIEAFADLSIATDLLVRHLKRERIPAVVRRPSPRLGGLSLLDLLAAGQTREVLVACRNMFQFGDAHA
ncbi:MAG: hypothetical protein KAJ78_09175 [Acidobacteria bacterium]|nr:hypothetical protein [Acidobacteriota bacterium]